MFNIKAFILKKLKKQNDMSNKRTVKFVDADNHKWEITAKITHRNGYPEFTMSGKSGQCHGSINPDGDSQDKLLVIWKKWHLNGMNAGTEKQQDFLSKFKNIKEYEKKSLLLEHTSSNKKDNWTVLDHAEFVTKRTELTNIQNKNKEELNFILENLEKYKTSNSPWFIWESKGDYIPKKIKPQNTLSGRLGIYFDKKRQIVTLKEEITSHYNKIEKVNNDELKEHCLKSMAYDIHPKTGELYQYGHGWIRRTLPENFWDDIEVLFNDIEDEEGEKFNSKKVEDCTKEELEDYEDNIIALGLHLDLTIEELEDISKSEYSGYEDCCYDVQGEEYYSGNEDEITEAVTDYIENTLWTFNSSFLSDYGSLNTMDYHDAELILTPLREQCESGNDAIKALVNWDDNAGEIVEDAISANGIGHFLNHYDGTSNEYEINGETYTVCQQ